jgi:hypothetical protein
MSMSNLESHKWYSRASPTGLARTSQGCLRVSDCVMGYLGNTLPTLPSPEAYSLLNCQGGCGWPRAKSLCQGCKAYDGPNKRACRGGHTLARSGRLSRGVSNNIIAKVFCDLALRRLFSSFSFSFPFLSFISL